jgi:hypothetical protein
MVDAAKRQVPGGGLRLAGHAALEHAERIR